nr:uncharacterized protein LOC128689762 isoform X10 [Cherax quadricarinatus]
MFEVLVVGLVGLTYACVQTLFFLNCLNSRRREQRRLEKVYRDSMRKIKGSVSEVRKHKKEAEKGVTVKNVKENGVCAEDENERISLDKTIISEESSKGQLVTRLVVNSGKEALPASQRALTGSHCVRVKNAILQLNNKTTEDEHDLANEESDPLSHSKNDGNLSPHGKNCGVATAAPRPPSSYNITVNSNMIEVREDGEPPVQPTEFIYESLETGPYSILAQVCEEEEEEEGEGQESLPRTADVYRDAADTKDSCTTQDSGQTCHQLLMLPGARDTDLVNTISQILQSPPESLELENEHLQLENLDTELTSENTVRTESLSVKRKGLKGGSADQIHWSSTSGACEANLIWTPQSINSAGSHQGTWTLPRSGRQALDAHGCLSRPQGGMCVGRKEGKYAPGGHTLPRPAAGRPSRRDEAWLREEQLHTHNTCHSPAMAGAATTTRTQHIARPRFTNDKFTGVVSDILCSDNSDSTASDLVAAHSDDSGDSERSGDSVHLTKSDRTDSAISSLGSDDKSSEHIVYGNTETQNTQPIDSQISVTIKLSASNQTETDSLVENVLQRDQVEASLHDCGCNIYEEIKSGSGVTNNQVLHELLEEDGESVGSGSQYENISESDTHADSGYESPVKADIHSSDDAVSTASSSSCHDHHYEDIDPSLMVRAAAGDARIRDAAAGDGRTRDAGADGRSREAGADGRTRDAGEARTRDAGGEGRIRESTRRGRSSPKDASQRDSCSSSSSLSSSRSADDEGRDEAARQRQRLQGLDDLIAGVPPPDYDDRQAPLDDASASPDVRTSGLQDDIPPPPEFGDGSGRNVSRDSPGRRQLHPTLSMPPTSSSGSHHGRAPLTRTNSEPPPPPPMPSATPSPKTSPSSSHRMPQEVDNVSLASSKPSSPRSTHNPLEEREDEGPIEEGVVRPSEFIRRHSQRSENGSLRGHKKLDRPTSLPLDVAEHYGRIMTDGKDRDAVSSNEELSQSPQLGKSQMNGKSLPFIPPKFPVQPSDSLLIKPSEYLRSLGGSVSRSPSNVDIKPPNGSSHVNDTTPHFAEIPDVVNSAAQVAVPPAPLPAIPEATEEELAKTSANTPPPPPAPPAPPASATNTLPSRNNTLTNGSSSKTVLPTISVTDLQSVQLRKIEIKVAKPTSVPLRIPITPEAAFTTAKNDVIAELKMGVDIPGIKKLKSERAKEEELHEKIEEKELSRQFSAVNFVDQVPEVDNAGNRIPEWKRQMLARKAAEKAKKEAEESRLQEAEERRMQAIPPWKRQLMTKKDDGTMRGSLYIPKVEEVKKIKVVNSSQDVNKAPKKDSEKENAQPTNTPRNSSNSTSNPLKGSSEPVNSSNTTVKKPEDTRQDTSEEPRMPWRTNLRKTNSKLNLLE